MIHLNQHQRRITTDVFFIPGLIKPVAKAQWYQKNPMEKSDIESCIEKLDFEVSSIILEAFKIKDNFADILKSQISKLENTKSFSTVIDSVLNLEAFKIKDNYQYILSFFISSTVIDKTLTVSRDDCMFVLDFSKEDVLISITKILT